MHVNRWGLAAVLLIAGSCFAQTGADRYAAPPQQGRGGQRQPSAEQLAEQQLQDAQRQIRETTPAAGRGQLGADGTNADDYVNKEDMFSVSVPCKFTKTDIVWATEYDSKVPGHVYSCKDGNTEYEMSVINYTDIEKIRAAQDHTDAAQGGQYAKIDLYASIDYASTKMRNEAAKVTYDAFHYMNLIPGHELQYLLPDGRKVYGAAYLHEYRLYIMKATVPAKGIPPLPESVSTGQVAACARSLERGTFRKASALHF